MLSCTNKTSEYVLYFQRSFFPSTQAEFNLAVTGRKRRLRNTIAKISFAISLSLSL